MKHLLFKLIMILVLLIALVSCQHQYPIGLVEADSLLYKNPLLVSSKLQMLRKDVDSKLPDDYNYWCLLTLMAKERTYQSVGGGDTLERLVSYYEVKHDVGNLAKAYYLEGRLMQEYHEYPLALSYFHRSLKMLDLMDNLKLRGLVNSQAGSILLDLGNVSLSADYYSEAFRCDSIVRDVKGMVFDMRDLAIVDMEQGNVTASLGKLYAALSLAQNNKQKELTKDIKFQLANVYLYGTNKLDLVWKNLYPSLCNPGVNASSAFLLAAEYYWAQDKNDSVKYYLDKVTKIGNVFQKCEAYRRLISISSYEDDVLSMGAYTEHYISLSDSTLKIKEHERKMKGQDVLKFMNQQDEIEHLQKSNEHKLYLTLSIMFLLVLMVIVFVIYYKMSVVRKLKVKNKITNIKLLASSADARRMDKHQCIYGKLQLDKYVERKKCLHEQTWNDLEKELNILYPNFKNSLYSCYNLSPFEYQICMLVKIGVSTSQIAILTAHAKTSVSTAKQRLYKKITAEQGKAEDLNRLLMFF